MRAISRKGKISFLTSLGANECTPPRNGEGPVRMSLSPPKKDLMFDPVFIVSLIASGKGDGNYLRPLRPVTIVSPIPSYPLPLREGG